MLFLLFDWSGLEFVLFEQSVVLMCSHSSVISKHSPLDKVIVIQMIFFAVSFKLINPVYFVSFKFLTHNCLFALEKQEQCWFCLHAF